MALLALARGCVALATPNMFDALSLIILKGVQALVKKGPMVTARVKSERIGLIGGIGGGGSGGAGNI